MLKQCEIKILFKLKVFLDLHLHLFNICYSFP